MIYSYYLVMMMVIMMMIRNANNDVNEIMKILLLNTISIN